MGSPTSDVPTLEIRERIKWLPGAVVASCPQCGRVFLIQKKPVTIFCPMCGKAQLQPQQGAVRDQLPEIVLQPQIEKAALNQSFADFAKGVPFKAPDLTAENLLSRLQLVFWPMWLVDADLKGDWQANMGFSYQVKTARERLEQEGWSSKSELRTQTRFEPRYGSLERHYDNTAVPALARHEVLVARLGKYDHQVGVVFKPELLQDAAILMPDLDPQQVTSAAEVKFTARAGAESMQAAGAQNRQEFNFRGKITNLNWTEFLLPLYSTYYADDDGKAHTVLVQAQSGKIYGARMASKRKARTLSLILAGLVLLALCSALLVVFGSMQSDGFASGTVLLVLALSAMLVVASIPLLRVNQWNANQRSKFPSLDE